MGFSLPFGFFDTGTKRAFCASHQVHVGIVPIILLAESFARVGAVITNTGNGSVFIGAPHTDLLNDGHGLPTNQSISIESPCEVWAVSDGSGPYVVTTFEEFIR